jgi:tRNA-specific 2-thiouridylase
LGILFYTVDFSKIFKKKVVDYFLEGYSAGLTPNPCVMCNKFIKFGQLLIYVRRLGFDYLATGHYARIARRDTKYEIRNTKRNQASHVSRITFHLLRARDEQKDQSYFLYNLNQSQLAHILFPVGDYTKKQVKAMAKEWNLPVAKRPESQEICFFPETDYRPFLRRQIPKKIIPGEVVDTKGRVIGKHFGLPLYTIGQRHGFSVSGKWKIENGKLIPPYYVIGKNAKKNQLIVGFGKETERKEFWVKEVNWICPNYQLLITNYSHLWVRIRHQGELLKCSVRRDTRYGIRDRKNENSFHVSRFTYHVSLSEPERGIAPGQAAVFYRKDEVLGGGIIAS